MPLFVPVLSFALPTKYIPLSTSAHTERFYSERKLLAEREPFPVPAPQCLQHSAAGISEEWQLSQMDPSLIACPIRLVLVGWYLTMPVLPGCIFGDFFIEDFPARLSYTGMLRYAPFLPPSHQLLSHSSPIPHLFLAQRLLNYPEKAITGAVSFGLASMKRSVRWRYSLDSRTGGFELCRRVRPRLVSSAIPHLSFSSSALATPPNKLMNERTARTRSTCMVILFGKSPACSSFSKGDPSTRVMCKIRFGKKVRWMGL